MREVLKLLPRLLGAASDSEEARQQAAAAAWAAAAGPQLRRVTAVVGLKRKHLIIATLSPAWKSELERMSGQLLFQLNSLLRMPLITSIEFVINDKMVRSSHPSPPRVRFSDLEKEEAQLMPLARAIPDQAVRAAFVRAAAKCLDRRSR
jgi:hypothetical protein